MSKTTHKSCSASTIVAITSSGYHQLKIDGYSRTKVVPNGSSIKSRSFTIGGCTWNIEYYPNGNAPDYADYISLYLRLEDSVADQAVKAQFKFSLLSNRYSHHSTQTSVVCGFLGMCPDFIEREDLGLYLMDDCLTIRCDVTVVHEFRTEDT